MRIFRLYMYVTKSWPKENFLNEKENRIELNKRREIILVIEQFRGLIYIACFFKFT